jgi:tryptophanyl-tRNA synthetase
MNVSVKQIIAKHMNDRLIEPQEKRRNWMTEIDSKESYQEVEALIKFPPKSL